MGILLGSLVFPAIMYFNLMVFAGSNFIFNIFIIYFIGAIVASIIQYYILTFFRNDDYQQSGKYISTLTFIYFIIFIIINLCNSIVMDNYGVSVNDYGASLMGLFFGVPIVYIYCVINVFLISLVENFDSRQSKIPVIILIIYVLSAIFFILGK